MKPLTPTSAPLRCARWRHRISRLSLAAATLATALTAAIAIALFALPGPPPSIPPYPGATVIHDRTGAFLRIAPGNPHTLCLPVAITNLSPWIVPALVAAEDKRFFSHRGIDPIAILRAAGQNLAAGHVVSGASTLSTLAVKLTHPRPRTFAAKLQEARQALRLETVLSKSDILEQYLNRTPFGGHLAGIEAASRRYFDKSASQLSLPEAALLVGIPQAPSYLRPDRHPDRALARRSYVLSRLAAASALTPAQAAEIDRHPLHLARPRQKEAIAPHFCDFIQTTFGPGVAYHTTLNPDVQRSAVARLRQAIDRLRPRGVTGGACLVLDVPTGTVRAWVGSPDFHDTAHAGQFDAVRALRSPGSTLKPFLYALAFDTGLLSPLSPLQDTPVPLRSWCPDNFDRTASRAPVSVRDALVRSLNLPAVDCVTRLGPESFLAFIRRLGFTSLDHPASHYGLGIALGGCDVSLLELANAYASLARLGLHLPVAVLDSHLAPPPAPRRVLSAEAAWLVADILETDRDNSPLWGFAADVALPRVAWKTGTSAGNRDAWTVMFNPHYVVAVWLGNPDGSPADVLVGIDAAAPVAGAVFRDLYPGGCPDWFSQPAGVAARTICLASGAVAGPGCSATTDEFFIPGISPVRVCPLHRCRPAAGCAAGAQRPATPRLRILSPAPGSVYRLLPDTPTLTQQLLLRAEADAGRQTLYWFLDGAPLASAPASEPVAWTLTQGSHLVACSTAEGHYASVTIHVADTR